MQKRILILGHTGFIGRHLTNIFVKNDWQVIGISRHIVTDNPKIKQFTADLNTAEGLSIMKRVIEDDNCNVVMNLVWDVAANCHSALTSIDSMHTALNIARTFIGCKVTGKKELIAAGTNAEYKPDCSDLSPLIEDLPSAIKPDSIYGVCKYATYLTLEKLCADAGIAFKWPRIFSAFGSGMRSTCFMPALVHALKNGEIYTVKNGLTITHFTPVEFVAEAVFQLVNNHPGKTLGAVNVATDKGLSVNEVATILINMMSNPRDAMVEINRTVKTEQIPSLYKLETLITSKCMRFDVTTYIKSMMQYF